MTYFGLVCKDDVTQNLQTYLVPIHNLLLTSEHLRQINHRFTITIHILTPNPPTHAPSHLPIHPPDGLFSQPSIHSPPNTIPPTHTTTHPPIHQIIQIHTYTHTHARAPTYIHTHQHIHIHIRTYIHKHTQTHTHTRARTPTTETNTLLLPIHAPT